MRRREFITRVARCGVAVASCRKRAAGRADAKDWDACGITGRRSEGKVGASLPSWDVTTRMAAGNEFQLDLHWVATDFNRTQAIAKQLVESQPELIQVTSTPATAAIMRETQTIPVVFTTVSDPIGAGFVQTLTRPGGNATGFVNIEGSLGGKWVEVLKEVAPGISRAAMMFNPKTSPQTGYYRESLEAAASSLAVEILSFPVGDREEIQKVMAGLGQIRMRA